MRGSRQAVGAVYDYSTSMVFSDRWTTEEWAATCLPFAFVLRWKSIAALFILPLLGWRWVGLEKISHVSFIVIVQAYLVLCLTVCMGFYFFKFF